MFSFDDEEIVFFCKFCFVFFGGFFMSLFFIFNVHADVVITEVMYNPDRCSDSDCEWVELWNNGSEETNLSGFELDGKKIRETTGSVEDIIIAPDSYVVFADELLDSDGDNESFEIFFGNGDGFWDEKDREELGEKVIAYDFSLSLTNTEDQVILFNGTDNVSEFTYVDALGADGNDYSLELTQEGEIRESLVVFGSPGRVNGRWAISLDYSDLRINEILPDPEGDDDSLKPLGEWIEIVNLGDKLVDLEGIWVEDSARNKLYVSDSTVLDEDFGNEGNTIVGPGEYLVVYRNGQTSFSLNNGGFEEVFLYAEKISEAGIFEETENDWLLDSMSYSDAISGMSIALIDGDWQTTAPTVGEENYYLGPCDWSLDILMDGSVFSEDDFEFEVELFRELGSSEEVSVSGEILDYYGETVKEYSPWTNEEISNSRTKDYSPNLAEGIYEAVFTIDDVECSDINSENDEVSAFFAINPDYQLNENSLEIETVYDAGSDDSYEWGEAFRVKVNIYKGDETKTAIELYAVDNEGEVVSERTKLNAYEEYQYYTLTLPLQLDANCNEAYPDGKLYLVLEGLGLEEKYSFEVFGISDDTCENYDDYAFLNDGDFGEIEAEEYQLSGLDLAYAPGEAFSFDLQFLTDESAHEYSAWAYVYKGSSCKSCFDGEIKREENLQEISLKANSIGEISYLIKLDDDISVGDYNLKVKIMKDDRKTADEITSEILVVEGGIFENVFDEFSSTGNGGEDNESGEERDFSEEFFVGSEYIDESIFEKKGGIVVYQSTSQRAYKLVPYMMLISLALMCYVVWKKA